ncbi:MAG: hypothetical protein CL897_02550 [Dehalococcoidia bacterium]|nr:hypothetical protein [Dehalococcoidia bacterium]HCV00700.1 hypothetical protein [Dehalococcoidia bacterium]
MTESDSVKELARLAREAAHMRWGREDNGSAPSLPGKGKRVDEDGTERMSGDQELAVLKALDPFWTRGIVKPEEGKD